MFSNLDSKLDSSVLSLLGMLKSMHELCFHDALLRIEFKLV